MSKTCIICCDNIDDRTNVEFLNSEKKWIKTDYCDNCIKYELKNTWKKYISNLKNVDCEASLKRLITNDFKRKKGHKIYYISPQLNNGEPIKKFKCNGEIFSGKLLNVPPATVIDKLTDKLNDLLPIVSGTCINTSTTSENSFDYLGKLKLILVEFNL